MRDIEAQEKIIRREIKKLEAMGGKFSGSARRWRTSFSLRHPIAFVLLSTFGLVATFYGFEKIIDKIDPINNNPWIVLALGLFILSITGNLLKKLR